MPFLFPDCFTIAPRHDLESESPGLVRWSWAQCVAEGEIWHLLHRTPPVGQDKTCLLQERVVVLIKQNKYQYNSNNKIIKVVLIIEVCSQHNTRKKTCEIDQLKSQGTAHLRNIAHSYHTRPLQPSQRDKWVPAKFCRAIIPLKRCECFTSAHGRSCCPFILVQRQMCLTQSLVEVFVAIYLEAYRFVQKQPCLCQPQRQRYLCLSWF